MMYIMTQVISITDFRRNLFRLADKVVREGSEIEVEKEGRRIIRISRIDDDPKERARKILALLPKLGGMWKDLPDEKFQEMHRFFRGKKEKKYMKDLGNW